MTPPCWYCKAVEPTAEWLLPTPPLLRCDRYVVEDPRQLKSFCSLTTCCSQSASHLDAGICHESTPEPVEFPAGAVPLHLNGSGDCVGKQSAHSRELFLLQNKSAVSLTYGAISQTRVLVIPRAGQPHVKTYQATSETQRPLQAGQI